MNPSDITISTNTTAIKHRLVRLALSTSVLDLKKLNDSLATSKSNAHSIERICEKLILPSHLNNVLTTCYEVAVKKIKTLDVSFKEKQIAVYKNVQLYEEWGSLRVKQNDFERNCAEVMRLEKSIEAQIAVSKKSDTSITDNNSIWKNNKKKTRGILNWNEYRKGEACESAK